MVLTGTRFSSKVLHVVTHFSSFCPTQQKTNNRVRAQKTRWEPIQDCPRSGRPNNILVLHFPCETASSTSPPLQNAPRTTNISQRLQDFETTSTWTPFTPLTINITRPEMLECWKICPLFWMDEYLKFPFGRKRAAHRPINRLFFRSFRSIPSLVIFNPWMEHKLITLSARVRGVYFISL